MKVFISGTDTNVGKTYIAALLIRALREKGVDCVGMKPICCGDRQDAEILRDAGDQRLDLNEVNPIWLRTPAAPYTAALVEERQIDLTLIKKTFEQVKSRHAAFVVEGVGGWRVPITASYDMSDLARDLGLSVIVVVANRLGALNHALLTVEAIRQKGISCPGLILNDCVEATEMSRVATTTNGAVLESLAGVPILFSVSFQQQALSPGLAWCRRRDTFVSI